MNWLLFVNLATLLCLLVSAAPPNIDYIVTVPPKTTDEELYYLDLDYEETSTAAEASTEVKNVSSEETFPEKHTNEKENGSENHLFIQPSSEGASETVAIEEETPTKREDLEPSTGQTETETSTQQTSEQSLNQTSVAQQESVSVSAETATESTTHIATSPTTKRPKPSKPKPPRTTTLKPLAVESPVTPPVTSRPTTVAVKPTKPTFTQQRYPCRCADGTCSCCTGIVLENFNVPLRSRACANVTYEPDDFAFNFRLAYNNIVLYNRRMSAKNPRPACIPINRYFGIKMCAKLSNVYMSGRNMHACLDFEGFFDDETAFKYSFNCFRVGSQGVAIVRPEDGGGLPPPPDEEEQTDEEYDDSARGLEDDSDSEWEEDSIRRRSSGWTGEVQVVPN